MKTFLSRGFSFIEVLIVMAMLGILATVLLVVINPNAQLGKGRDAKRISDISYIQTALEEYRHDNGSYPSSVGWPTCGNPLKSPSGSITYINNMPCDPLGSSSTFNLGDGQYCYQPNGSYDYKLSAKLEADYTGSSDTHYTSTNSTGCSDTCSSTTCWYYISTPN